MILSNKIIHRSIWIAYFLFTLFVIYTIVPSSILNVMYYDVCETMMNTRGAEEVGSEILDECVFGSGNLINTLDLREGFTLIEDIKEESSRYKQARNSTNQFQKTDEQISQLQAFILAPSKLNFTSGLQPSEYLGQINLLSDFNLASNTVCDSLQDRYVDLDCSNLTIVGYTEVVGSPTLPRTKTCIKFSNTTTANVYN